MEFFRKKSSQVRPSFEDDIADIESTMLKEWAEAEKKQKEIAAENHKKKGLQTMPHAIEQLVRGLQKRPS